MTKIDEKYIKKEQDRINAVNRYLKGERHSKIYRSLDRKRSWFYKWINRYKNSTGRAKKNWFKDQSRAPKNIPRKTKPNIETVVVNVRKSLVEGKTEDTKYRCIGSDEISLRMNELDYSEDETPSISTINRIIKRNKLVIQKKKRYVRCKSKKRHTLLNPTKVNEINQMDFVGPRYIKGYGAISSLNLIDLVGKKVYIQQYASRNMDYVIEFLTNCWTDNPIPNYLQMDNGAYFIGDLKHSRHFSRVVRLCLYFGVRPVFIAPCKPWMNGAIEDFNGDFGEKFWERKQFTSLEDIRKESKIFVKRHDNLQDWKQRKTTLESIPERKIPKDIDIDLKHLPLTEGHVHFIRQVKKDGTVNVLNEEFAVDVSLAYEYVWITIDTKRKRMDIHHREKDASEARLIKEDEYEIKEKVLSGFDF